MNPTNSRRPLEGCRSLPGHAPVGLGTGALAIPSPAEVAAAYRAAAPAPRKWRDRWVHGNAEYASVQVESPRQGRALFTAASAAGAIASGLAIWAVTLAATGGLS